MPREFSRGHRLSDLIQRELSLLIQRELKDPRIGMVTINEVKVSRDLAFANVYFTLLGEKDRQEAVSTLAGAAGFLRTELAKVLTTRKTPTLRFHYDDTVENGQRITHAIDEALADDEHHHKP